ncbi:chitinase-3-like protein 2 [Cydia pomonella]|uniref:chitinase-3-like protein 2 n=1 Tax=Cydia pomonella TaxID=82600 RepID=UPI002ADE3513|nr:chitinase-3-like protein 2 [Cydia pomonella]
MEKDIDSNLEEGDLVELLKVEGRLVMHARALRWAACLMVFVGATLSFCLLMPPARPAPKAALVCYYNTPRDVRSLQPRDIPPYLCTHINVAFASVRNKTLHLDPPQLATIRQVVLLRKSNPKLKVLVSVGGAGENGFADMVINHASRKQFIRSIKSLLHNYTLDGIDLDWEFPTGNRQRQHFSQLLREIRMEFLREKRDYLLTVAVAAEETIADASYDYDQLNLYTDFLNVMTYDFHFYTKMTPFTGFNSPLYSEPGQRLFLSTLNVNYTMHMYLAKGLAPGKLVVGIPTYGHSFQLVNPGNTLPGSPAAGPGSLGTGGFVSYPDVCQFVKHPGGKQSRDAAAAVPYAHRGTEWLSYDDGESVAKKAEFAAQLGLRGAMVYSLDSDDYSNVCGLKALPLVSAVRRALNGPLF